MTDSLRAEVVPPRRKSTWLLLVGLTAPLAALSMCERTEKMTVFTPPTLPKVKAVVQPAPEPARVISSELKLVFRAGDHSYVKLSSTEALPRGKAKIVKDERAVHALWAADASALPSWVGTKVFVDNDCTATITRLHYVSRMSIENLEYTEPGRTVSDAMAERGVFIAGELDGCDGTYARSAALPKVVVPETRPDDAELVKKAKRELLRSPAAKETERVWVEDYQSTETWTSQAQYDIRTFRHPLTAQTWISIHAWNGSGCGDPSVNIWGLFRVDADGTLFTAQIRDLGDMAKIHQIIDIEGDGGFELIGEPWMPLDTVVTDSHGDVLETLELPYDGCPC
ncbi:MAG TPA: hypothetical protein VMZ53_02580 [Kofleriaceae bacterium]|nr:hypothetical protein [Kofleriaceae bacterium]